MFGDHQKHAKWNFKITFPFKNLAQFEVVVFIQCISRSGSMKRRSGAKFPGCRNCSAEATRKLMNSRVVSRNKKKT